MRGYIGTFHGKSDAVEHDEDEDGVVETFGGDYPVAYQS